MLKAQIETVEAEKRRCEEDNATAIAEQDRVDMEYQDLLERIEQLKTIKAQLEVKQKNTEEQLEEFVLENERIRKQIKDRDELAERLKQQTKLCI